MVEEVRQRPRGQIQWTKYARQQMARGRFHELPCRHPELGPDLLLQSFLRWGLESVHRSLVGAVSTDALARLLVEEATELLAVLENVPSRFPVRQTLDEFLRGGGLPTAALRRGIQALGWLVDERGLAGTAESDGLAWTLTMHELFERWVEHLCRVWAAGFGATVKAGRSSETLLAMDWNRRGARSLTSLIPDIIVHHPDRTFIVDAKYKGQFEELDHHRWLETAEELRADHRHDVHQVLAYASAIDAPNITAVLAYPLRLSTWQRLSDRERTVTLATVTGGGREVHLALLAVPLQVPATASVRQLVAAWEGLR